MGGINERPGGVSRRRFLAIGAGSVGLVAQPAPANWLLGLVAPGAAGATPASFTRTLVRAADQLRLRLEFVNLVRSGANLVALDPALPSFIRMVLPAQHVVEQSVPLGTTPPSAALRHRSAGTTRLVFVAAPPVPLTTSFLLDLANLVPALDPRANVGGGTALVGPPSEDVTAIEIPEGLILTPDSTGRFEAPTAPIAFGGVSEVWRARLGVSGGGATPTVRAIYEAGGDDTFPRPLTETDRSRIVTATSAYTDTTLYPNHEPVLARELVLSTLSGGWLDVRGSWSGGTGPLAAWVHRSLTGRDLHAHVTTRGYLMPFGHRASITTVTDRIFTTDANGVSDAVTVQASYLSIADPTIETARTHAPYGGRQLPFTSVTASAPSIPVSKGQIIWGARSIPTTKAWIVTAASNAARIKVNFVGTDHAGSAVGFSLPVVFVSEQEAYRIPGAGGTGSILDDLVAFYADPASMPFREVLLDQIPISYAPDEASGGVLTQKPTERLEFSLSLPVDGSTTANFQTLKAAAAFGTLGKATVRDGVVSAVVADPDACVAEVRYATAFRDHGMGASNPGGTFLTLNTPVNVAFANEGTSLVKPNFEVTHFSTSLGAGPLPPPPNSSWDPADILDDTAKVLGTLLLREIVDLVQVGSDIGSSEGLPKMTVTFEPEEGTPERMIVRMVWKPPLRSSGILLCAPADLPEPLLQGRTRAKVVVEQVIPFDGGAATDELTVSLDTFALGIPGNAPVIALYFNKLTFSMPPEGGHELQADIAAARFAGGLEWLDPVQDFLGGTSGNLVITLTESELSAELNILPPDFAFGIVSVRSPAMQLVVVLPFDGSPTLIGINLGSRTSPIGVTVMGIGGSFWMAVELEATDTPFRRLTLELAFVLEAAADFVVGSAAVRLSIGAGVTVDAQSDVTLTAFVSLTGVVELLGFQVLNTEATAAMVYDIEAGRVEGSLTITIGVLGFIEYHDSVDATFVLDSDPSAAPAAGRLAAASIPDTSFVDRFDTSGRWSTYCSMFA